MLKMSEAEYLLSKLLEKGTLQEQVKILSGMNQKILNQMQIIMRGFFQEMKADPNQWSAVRTILEFKMKSLQPEISEPENVGKEGTYRNRMSDVDEARMEEKIRQLFSNRNLSFGEVNTVFEGCNEIILTGIWEHVTVNKGRSNEAEKIQFFDFLQYLIVEKINEVRTNAETKSVSDFEESSEGESEEEIDASENLLIPKLENIMVSGFTKEITDGKDGSKMVSTPATVSRGLDCSAESGTQSHELEAKIEISGTSSDKILGSSSEESTHSSSAKEQEEFFAQCLMENETVEKLRIRFENLCLSIDNAIKSAKNKNNSETIAYHLTVGRHPDWDKDCHKIRNIFKKLEEPNFGCSHECQCLDKHRSNKCPEYRDLYSRLARSMVLKNSSYCFHRNSDFSSRCSCWMRPCIVCRARKGHGDAACPKTAPAYS